MFDEFESVFSFSPVILLRTKKRKIFFFLIIITITIMQSIQQRSVGCFRLLCQKQSRNGINHCIIRNMSTEQQNKWQPKKRLSRIAMNQLRDLNATVINMTKPYLFSLFIPLLP